MTLNHEPNINTNLDTYHKCNFTNLSFADTSMVAIFASIKVLE